MYIVEVVAGQLGSFTSEAIDLRERDMIFLKPIRLQPNLK
jgi:hypothetical protein